MSLITFTIILAILVLILGGVIVYLFNYPIKKEIIKETTKIEDLDRAEVNQLEDKTDINHIITKKLTDEEKVEINKILSQTLNLSSIQSTNELMSNILKRRRNIK